MNTTLKSLTGLAFLTITATANAAPVQWTITDGGNDHWYEAVAIDSPLDWLVVKDMAASSSYLGLQGHLATITSADENTWIYNNVTSLNYVLGGHDMNVEGTWEWVTGEEFTYTNWYAGEPNQWGPGESGGPGTGEEDWLMFWLGTGQWNDSSETSNSITGYIVEYDSLSAVPIPAALFMFAPALLGFIGFRRRAKTLIS